MRSDLPAVNRAWVLLAATLVTVLAVALNASGAEARALPDTSDGIHLGLVFDNLVPKSAKPSVPVDLIWGARRPHGPLGVANGVYVPFDRELTIHSLLWWRMHHPTWVIYQCDRKTPALEFGDPNIPIDISNPAVRAFQWETEVRPALARGYSAIAFDNLRLFNIARRCGHYDSRGAWVQQYSGGLEDSRFRRDVIAWARHFGTRIRAYPSHPTMWFNYSYETREPVADNLRLISTADLILDERGVSNWGDARRPWPTPSGWARIFRSTRALEAGGHCLLLVSQQPQRAHAIPRAARVWNVANYLLMKGRCTFLHISGVQEYGKLLTYPEYRVPIGRPTAGPRKRGGVWWRAYSNGLVLVNPRNAAAEVRVDETYTDDSGRPITSPVRLSPHGAAILIPLSTAARR